MIRSLVLLWGFPNQLSSDSWAVGFEEADPCSALDCETTNGSGSKIFCPAEKVMWAAMQQTTGCSPQTPLLGVCSKEHSVRCPRPRQSIHIACCRICAASPGGRCCRE